MEQAIEVYRSTFKPSGQLQEPYLMLGFNVCAAQTEKEARYLRTSSLQSVVRLRHGMPGQLPPPIEGFEANLTAQDEQLIAQFTSCSTVGTPDTVARGMADFVTRTGADELMIVSQIYDHESRLRSFEIAASVELPLHIGDH